MTLREGGTPEKQSGPLQRKEWGCTTASICQHPQTEVLPEILIPGTRQIQGGHLKPPSLQQLVPQQAEREGTALL